MVWTHFHDMNSGGGQKLEWRHIFIETPEEEAKAVFYAKFGRNPERVTCTCCGEDYSISEYETLEEATAFERGCLFDDKKKKCVKDEDGFNEYKTLKAYLKSGEAKVIYAKEIKKHERKTDVPEEGYVWRD